MKVIIAGGRDYKPKEDHARKIISLLKELEATHVVSGTANGADNFGEQIAYKMNLGVITFPANWKKWGRSAGPIRNEEMAKFADYCILLPGGKGTASMRQMAIKHQIQYIEIS